MVTVQLTSPMDMDRIGMNNIKLVITNCQDMPPEKNAYQIRIANTRNVTRPMLPR